jgi:GT2 family glycosyltransferase
VKPTASIVVVHHRGLQRLQRTLRAAAAQAAADGAEVILVDNGSREGAAREVSHAFPSVRIVALASNAGFAAGCRRGSEASEAPWLVFLNDDAVPEDGWLAALLSTAEKVPRDVKAVAGRLTDADGRRNDFSGGFLTFDGHAFAERSGAPLGSGREPGAGEELLFACGGNMLVSREAFFESGGFDDDFFAYQEDVDFGWRQWILGNRILFEPRASARHEGGATGEALGVFRRGFLIEKNAFATAYKNLDEELFFDLMPAVFATFLSRVAAMIDRRNLSAEALRRDPYESLEPSRRRRGSARLRRLFGFREWQETVTLSDPLTIAQLRALLSIFARSANLEEKRRQIQERRRRPDREIFARFPLAIVPTYPGDELFATEFFDSLRPRKVPLAARTLADIFSDRA